MRKIGDKKNQDPFSLKAEKPKLNKLENTYYKQEWTEDSYLEGQGGKDSMGISFDFSYLRKLSFFLLVMILLLLGRALWLQVIKGDHYGAMAQGNRIRVVSVEPSRGIVYDRNQNVLVQNTANFMLYLIPGDLPQEDSQRREILDNVIGILNQDDSEGGVDREILEGRIEQAQESPVSAYEPIFIQDNIEYEKAISLYLITQEMPGIVLSNKTRREYPNQVKISQFMPETDTPEAELEETIYDGEDVFQLRSLSHILGYTGKISREELDRNPGYSPIDYIGKSGIEFVWEGQLKGEKGRKQVEVDALGREIRVISEEDPVKGNSLVLSLDYDLQAKTEMILKEYLDNLNEDKAAAVIMDPNNGEILSLVSLPGFDNNLFARGFSSEEYQRMTEEEDYSLYNRAISGEYPAGSTIKPVIAAAALEEGVVTESTTVNSTGGINVGPWFFPDWRSGGHGITNVRKAIAQSVNTFFYYVGGGYRDFSGLGLEKIINYDRMFGLGDKSGLDLPGESPGFLPSREWKEEQLGEPWYIGDTYHLSIGQGFLLTTPLQVANFTSVFANQGTLYRPYLLKEILDHEGELVNFVEPEVINQDFIDDYVLRVVREGMRETVTRGSARSLSNLDVAVAGKTGTAQWSSEKENHAWFASFAPYDDPEIVITVLVERGGEGSDVAVPITRDILEYYFDN